MNKKQDKFVLVIRGYSSDMYNWQPEEKYHLHALKVASEMGFKNYVLIKKGASVLQSDPDFDSKTTVIEYGNIFNFLIKLIQFTLKNSTLYTNGFEIESFIAPLFSRKVIFIAHGQQKRDGFLKQFIQKVLYSLFARVRLNIVTEKKFLEDQGYNKKKLFLVPLPIAINTFKKEVSKERNQDIVYFGNVTKVKGLHIILHALKKLHMKGYPTKLHIIGSIHDSEFWDIVKSLNLNDKIVHRGYMTQTEAATILNQFQVYVNSSSKEGQCLAVYQAALAGCALCLPNIISFMDVFKDKALFHNAQDYEKLAENIIYYLENQNTRDNHVILCQNMISQNYSKEKIEPLMKDLFKI